MLTAQTTDYRPADPCPFASRGGYKLDAALRAFELDLTGYVCADLGCSTGGFVDCLLQYGASKVHAVDTGYGVLAWKLRQDDRVSVHERRNALHFEPIEACDLVTVDIGWTKQAKAVPIAKGWLKPTGCIISLIKPHYEVGQPRMEEAQALQVANDTAQALADVGWHIRGHIVSPITGSKGGNIETLVLLALSK